LLTEHGGDNVASIHRSTEWWGVRTKVQQRRQLIESVFRGTGSGIAAQHCSGSQHAITQLATAATINITSHRKLGEIALSYLHTINKGLHTPRAEQNSVAVGTTGEGFSPATALRKPGIHRLLILRTNLRLGFVSLQDKPTSTTR